MLYYYHYTDEEGAKHIIRSGKIQASLGFMTSGDAAFGNRVYLTTLKPGTLSKAQIAHNNWGNTRASSLNKTKNYFVLEIPASAVKDANDRVRNIHLFGHGNDLRLEKFKWWLKNYDSGEILASYKYLVKSIGPASLLPELDSLMGDYTITEETVNGRPVYKQNNSENYLYIIMGSNGEWFVRKGPVDGENCGCFQQESNYNLGSDSALPWKYFDMQWKENDDDSTLKAYAYIKCDVKRSIKTIKEFNKFQ